VKSLVHIAITEISELYRSFLINHTVVLFQ